MKHHRLGILVIIALCIGVAAGAHASMNATQDEENLYTASFKAREPIGSGSVFTHSFNSIPNEGFSNIQGQLTLTLQPVKKGKGAPVIDVTAGDPDQSKNDWFILADNFKVNSKGKVSFFLSNSMLESILGDGNGNFAFSIKAVKGDVILKAARVAITGTAVPIPSALWLLGSGLLGLVGFRKALYI